MNVAYTWAHALTTNQSDRSSGIQSSSCIRCDYGRATLDRRHVLSANYVYDLPWHRTQQGIVGRILGDYEITGILVGNSGLPFTVFAPRRNGDPAAIGVNTSGSPNNGRVATPRPNQVGDPNSGAPKTWDKFFNTSAFVAVAIGGATGNERRGAVTGPGLWRYDMAFIKNTNLSEQVHLQFRAEAFNLFNHTNFSSIGTTMPLPSATSTTFGTVTNTRDPRILQLALKLSF